MIRVIITAVGILLHGPLDSNSTKEDVFHVKFEDIKAVELEAYRKDKGGELRLWLSDIDSVITYPIFDDSTYNLLQEALIKTWENR